MNQKILVAEDNVSILTGLTDYLTKEGFDVATATNGKTALAVYQEMKPDLLLLDIMMPELSGYEVCKEIRKKDADIKIIMLTAKGQEIDKVIGLEIGADDYIVKPFSLKELVARIRAVLRRTSEAKSQEDLSVIAFGDISVDPATLKGIKGSTEFDVSPREVQLLKYFQDREGKAIDRNEMLEQIWGIRYSGTTRTLDQHISKLRQKIEDDPNHPKHILTVHRVGYRFVSK